MNAVVSPSKIILCLHDKQRQPHIIQLLLRPDKSVTDLLLGFDYGPAKAAYTGGSQLYLLPSWWLATKSNEVAFSLGRPFTLSCRLRKVHERGFQLTPAVQKEVLDTVSHGRCCTKCVRRRETLTDICYGRKPVASYKEFLGDLPNRTIRTLGALELFIGEDDFFISMTDDFGVRDNEASLS